jgi:hypothetical protein
VLVRGFQSFESAEREMVVGGTHARRRAHCSGPGERQGDLTKILFAKCSSVYRAFFMGLFVSPIRDSGLHTRFWYKPAIKAWETN